MDSGQREVFAARLKVLGLNVRRDPKDDSFAYAAIEVPEKGTKAVLLLAPDEGEYVYAFAMIRSEVLESPEQLSAGVLLRLLRAGGPDPFAGLRFITAGDHEFFVVISVFHFSCATDEEVRMRVEACARMALRAEAAVAEHAPA